jgi:fatty-acyl-CoA synthase
MNLGIAVTRNARARPNGLAAFDPNSKRTWFELDQRTNRLANALREKYGVQPGDRVALLVHNRLEVVEVLAATHKAAAVYVGLNFRMEPDDLDGVFENAEPRVLISEMEYADEARRVASASGVALILIGGTGESSYESVLSNGSVAPSPVAHRSMPDDHACIVYTSGTTGRPKGVLFDHAAMLQHATVAVIEYEITHEARYLIQIPHNSSVNITIAPCLVIGAAVGFADNRGFDPETFADTVEAAAVTHTFLVPTQLMRVHAQLQAQDPRLGSIDTLGYGASPIAPDRLGDLVDRFGPVFLQLYGMAEVASIGTLLSKQDHVRALADSPELLRSCGRASLAIDVRVVDAAGDEVADGERGEVIFGGPHLMRGYYRDPERTAEALRDGWVYSGDIATRDAAGYLSIVDRTKNLIIRGGQNIAPTDIENVLYQYAGILEAAVVGAPDPTWGERIVAVIAPQEGVTIDLDEVRRFCESSGLARFKRPEEIRIAESLPKNAVGKIDKRQVRAMFWDGIRSV